MSVTVRKRSPRGVLFLHNNFPAQFGFLAEMLQERGIKCTAICSENGVSIPGVPANKWRLQRGTSEGIFDPAAKAEADMIRGAAAAEVATSLKEKGYDPYLIIGHPGWGETLFIREIFEGTPLICYAEFFYHASGVDAGFDPEFKSDDIKEKLRIVGKNATLSLSYTQADRLVVPTPFHASLLPDVFASKTSIIHEGVDTRAIDRKRGARFRVSKDLELTESTPVITFVNRQFEPLRGYHVFMRALPIVLEKVPDAHVLLIGGREGSGYGARSAGDSSWKDVFLSEVKDRLDLSRVHFPGWLPKDRLLTAMSVSRVHVYYTYPFVLSWSLLEAMASRCVVVASDTPPVRDIIEDGRNGILRDFFDHELLAEEIVSVCRHPERYSALGQNARQTIVEEYDRTTITGPQWYELMKGLAPQIG